MEMMTVERVAEILKAWETEWVALSLTCDRQMGTLFGPKAEAASRRFHDEMFKKLAADPRRGLD
jgi:hypothetical protein